MPLDLSDSGVLQKRSDLHPWPEGELGSLMDRKYTTSDKDTQHYFKKGFINALSFYEKTRIKSQTQG